MPNVGVGYGWKDQAVMAFGAPYSSGLQLSLALPLGLGRVSHTPFLSMGLSYFLGSRAEKPRAVTLVRWCGHHAQVKTGDESQFYAF